MKRLLCLFLGIMFCLFTVTSSGETLVTYGGTFLSSNTGLQAFLADNPSFSLSWSDTRYFPASAFVTALLTHEFQCDLFRQGTAEADWYTLMEKGYCLDLSGSSALTAAVQRMHPHIAAEAMSDGHLYAIPVSIYFKYFRIIEETWLNAGYTTDDVPQTFPEFLDFLSAWCDRIEDNPEANIVAVSGWGEDSSSAAYIAKLTEVLINEVIMQYQYAGEKLSFNTPEIIALLNRCTTIGERLYQLESKHYNAALFEEIAGSLWPEKASSVVFFRLNEEQSKLINATLNMWAINASSSNAEKAVELLEKAATVIDDPSAYDDLFLYQDAQPRLDPDYEKNLAHWTAEKENAASLLQNENLDADAREDLEKEVQKYQDCIDFTEAHKWLVTPEQLEDYKTMVDHLYFPPINIFHQSSEGYEALDDLYKQFGYGKLTAEQFVQRLDQIATMMYLEE
ncbi:MAG: hypothetical protein Q4B32_00975 [Clostridia bacterium]|nr:hypothetical protein [Clostridia bacterium]